MEASSIRPLQADGAMPDLDQSSTHSPARRSVCRSKVWRHMSWFKKHHRLSEASGSSAVTSPRDSRQSEEHLTFSGCSGESSSSSTSSSELDLVDAVKVENSFIKRCKKYPNSEIVEQNCLRPSIAKALFIQLDTWLSRKDGPSTSQNLRVVWPKKKKRVSDEDGIDGYGMARATSMPGGMLSQGKCHCAACCSCTPRDRMCGPCTARRSTSTMSLDTGLAALGISMPYSPLDRDQSNMESSESCLSSTKSLPVAAAKSNSLPSQTSTPKYDTCATCNKLVIPYSMIQAFCDKVQSTTTRPVSHSYLPELNFCRCEPERLSQDNKHSPCKSSRNGAQDCAGQLKAGSQLQVLKHQPSIMHSQPSTMDSQSSIMHSQPSTMHLQPSTMYSQPSTLHSQPSTIHYQPSTMYSHVRPSKFKERVELIKCWFTEFNDEQKNLVLKQLLDDCSLPQLHMLSMEMEPRLHASCPPNCHDRLSWLPQALSLHILSYLDPVSLCQASAVSRSWYSLATDTNQWKRFCGQPKWRLSRAGEGKQLLHHMMLDGTIQWKQVFADRYRLRNNWLKGRCNVRTFEGHSQGISCVQFDDTRIVSGSSDKTIKVWNIRTNNPWAVQTLAGHSGTVRCLHLDGNRLVSGSTDRSIKVWDLSTQQSWSSIACKVTMVGHTDTVRCLQVDAEKVVSGSYDKTLKVWDIRTGTCRKTLRGHTAAVLCAQFDSTKIVSGSCDKTIKVWSFEGQCMMTLQGHKDAVTCLQFDNSRIFSGSLDCNLMFWDINTGHCINTIDWKASEGHTGVVRCLQADSWRVVSASDDRTLKVWSLETGQRLVTLRNHSDGVTCLQFNDSVIVSGSYDKMVKLWDFSCC